jgi:addiction module HigA family antidote
MAAKKLSPVHPGEILLEEFLRPLGISQNRLGRNLGIPAQRINEIVRGSRSILAQSPVAL